MRTFAAALIVIALLLPAGCARKHRPEPPFDAATKLKEAGEKIDGSYYEEARQILEEIRRNDTTQEFAPLAVLKLADSYIKEGESEYETAIDTYNEFITLYPRHKYAAYAQFQIGALYFKFVEGPERGYEAALRAVESFETLNKRYPRNPYRLNADAKLTKARAVLAEYEFMVGDFYYNRMACKGAIDRLEGMIEQYPDNTQMSESLSRLAVCYAYTGDDATSNKAMAELESRAQNKSLVEDTRRDVADARKARDAKRSDSLWARFVRWLCVHETGEECR